MKYQDTYYKQCKFELVEKAEGKPLVAIVSTEDQDSDGDIIHQGPTEKGEGWLLDSFNSKPRIFWNHDRNRPNFAKARAWVDQDKLLLEVKFDMKDPFAAELDRKYRDEFLTDWSVGFRGHKSEPVDDGSMGLHFYEQTLKETSAVNIGANPYTDTVMKALRTDDIEKLEQLEKDFLELREELETKLKEIERVILNGRKVEREEIDRMAELQDAIARLNKA
jgi:HK97 family phage prohead protease